MNQTQHVIDFPLGELSPSMLGRYDQQAYNKGAREITNLWPQYPGGLTQRAGSKYRCATHGGRFIPFQISNKVAYILEFVAGLIYIYKNDGTQLMNGTEELSFVTPWTSDAIDDIHVGALGDSIFFFHESAMVRVLTYLATDTFSLEALSYIGLDDDMPFDGTGEYPATGCFHDGRLYYGGPTNTPEELGASYAGNKAKYTFDGTITADSNIITNVSATAIALLRVGDSLTADEIPDSTITELGKYTITLDNNATSSNDDAELTRPKRIGFHDFLWYETIVSVSKQERDPMHSFEADTTEGSTTLSNIARSAIYDEDTDEGIEVGDRVYGDNVVDKDAISFVCTTTLDSNILTYVSSSIIKKLTVGETLTGTYIPESLITALGTNSITIDNNATLTSDEGTVERDEVRTYVTEVGETSIEIDREATATEEGATVFTGWPDPETTAYHTCRTTSDKVLSATAFRKRLAGDMSSKILWMVSGQHLVVGTLGGERIIPAGTTSQTFTCKKMTAFGSAPIQPVILGETLFFVSSDRKHIREYYYQDATQAYHSPNLNILADHILEDKVQQLDFTQAPSPIIFARTGAGELIGCAYEKTYNFAAWFRVNIDDATIASFCTAPDTDGVDLLFCNVKRGDSYYMETIAPPGYGDPHIDAYVEATVASGEVSGLSPLSGSAKLIHGTTEYDVTVTDGVATVDSAIADDETVYVGYEMPWTLELMPIQAQTSQGGSAALKTKNICGATYRLASTYPFYATAAGMTVYPVPATGADIEDIQSPVQGRWITMPSLKMTNKSSLGFTLRAVEILLDSGG